MIGVHTLLLHSTSRVTAVSPITRSLRLHFYLSVMVRKDFYGIANGSGPLNSTRRHGHFLNATWGPSDMTGGGKSIVTCNIAIS